MIPPVPPVIELPAPLAVNCVTPDPPPKMVEAAVAVTVSFGAAKTAVGVVVVIALPPAVVSTTAEAPVTVTAECVVATTTGPDVVVTPLPENTVKVVLELK
jgi:hypothetical protein